MQPMRRFLKLTSGLLAIFFGLESSACHRWVPVQSSPASVLEDLGRDGPDADTKVRLHVGPDSTLSGWVSGILIDTVLIRDRKINALENTGVPLDSVERLDFQQANSLATGALLIGIAAVVGFAVVAITYIVAVSDPLY